MTGIKYYYVNARLNGKTALLAGPFVNDVKSAEDLIDACLELFEQSGDALAPYASYGVVGLNASQGLGLFNKKLRAAGHLNVPVDIAN